MKNEHADCMAIKFRLKIKHSLYKNYLAENVIVIRKKCVCISAGILTYLRKGLTISVLYLIDRITALY